MTPCHAKPAMLLSTAALLFATCTHASVVWDVDANGDWDVASNWLDDQTSTARLPGAGDQVIVQRLSTNPVVTLDIVTSVGRVNVGHDDNGIGTLVIEDGAALTFSSSRPLNVGYNGTGYLIQNGGTVTTVNNRTVEIGSNTTISGGGNGTYTMNGGTLNSGEDITVGLASGTSGTLIVNDGTVVADDAIFLGFDAGSSGTMIVNGGNVGNNVTRMRNGVNGTGGMQVRGSSATIDFTTYTQVASATLGAFIDNGGISAMDASATLAGTLNAGVVGGTALTTTNSFTIIHGSITGDFTTGPDAAMWSTSASTASDYVLSLVNPEDTVAITSSVTDVDVAGGKSASHVVLNGLNTSLDLSVYLDVDPGTGMTVGDLIDFFAANNLSATTTAVDDYDVLLTFAPEATTSYYSWDLSEFNGDALVSGVGFSQVPEPATLMVLALGGLCVGGPLGRTKRLR